MNSVIFTDILRISASIWIILSLLIFTLTQLFFYTYSTLFIFGAILLGVQYLRVKQPPKENVAAILGRDPSDPADDGLPTFNTVAHRGMGLDAPENSLAAFQYSVDRGIKMIELDLALTKDGFPIIFHDVDSSRLSGEKLVIRETNWADLCRVDIAAKHPLRDRFPNTRIATLEETLDFCLQNKIKIIIDLKGDDYEMVKVVHKMFKKRNIYDQVMISGFNPFMLYVIRRGDPNIVCSMALERYQYQYSALKSDSALTRIKVSIYKFFLRVLNYVWWITHPWAATMIGLSAILLNREFISVHVTKFWRDRNIRLMIWTVNHPAEKLYYVKCLKTTYLTDTFIGETSAYNNNDPNMNGDVMQPATDVKMYEAKVNPDERCNGYEKVIVTSSKDS